MTESEIRNAAEALLTYHNDPSVRMDRPTNDDILESTSHSLSSLDRIPGEDVISGAKTDGYMSTVRRSFCLFILFDLLLTILIWLTCIMLIGSSDIIETLKFQIIHYKIGTSLFDIMVAAIIRFIVLLIFYGCLHANTRVFVALTTAGTTVFLILKVFYYNWAIASQPAFQVILILISFVLSWAETWFLDFRVLPQELLAQQYIQNRVRNSDSLQNLVMNSHLNNPVLRYFFQRLPRPLESTESVGNFYSPMESAENSDDEGYTKVYSPAPDLKKKGVDTLDVAWKLLNSSGWRSEKESQNGDVISSKQVPALGKVFKLKTLINLPPKILLEELYDNIENITSWNKTIIESKRVKIIDERTDVTYQVSAPGGNGIISSRDFVTLRHWSVINNCYVIAGISVIYPTIPPNKQHTRGENGPCCWVMRPLGEDPNSCYFEFLLNTNLKGWIPSYVLDTALTSVLLEYAQFVRQHAEKIS